jgi:hypothetical protein
MILNWSKYLEAVGNISISDFDSYVSGLELGQKDKLFFLNRIEPDVYVDFGCADGSILSRIKKIKPEVEIIGYDIDESMLSRARKKLGDECLLTSDWNIVLKRITEFKSPALILSSVIHEVYSYSNNLAIKKFWESQVFNGKFKWICIRDMMPKSEIYKHQTKRFIGDVMKVRKKSDKFYLNSFEKKWGKISNNYKSFVHYLLKYKYIDNWDREVEENYVPITLETLYKKIPKDYQIIYQENFILPSLQEQVKKDFDITVTHTTHTKMIIQK